MKHWGRSFDWVVWKISYVNLNMLLATIPVYDFAKDDEDENGNSNGNKKSVKVSDENNIVNFLS